MLMWLLAVFILNFKEAMAMIAEPTRFSLKPGNILVSRNITPECLAHTEYWMSEFHRGVPWALNMLDSYTKLPTGYLLGSNNHLGSFDQCLAISVQDGPAKFKGQYCRALINTIMPGEILTPRIMYYAFCLPSSCDTTEIQELMQNYIGPELGIIINFIWDLNPLDCAIKEPSPPLPHGALIFITIVSIIVCVVVFCALAEWLLKEKTPALIRACSLISTCRSLFDVRKHPSDIPCLHGLRVGSMLLIILGHRFGLESSLPLSNPDIFDTYYANPLIMTVANGAMLAVDTFFLLSGLLMCTSFLREVRRKKSFDVIKFYIYRYLRLAVPMGAVISLYITILPLTGKGPIWNYYFYYESRNCKANWWPDMLFVNNYINQEGFWGCLGQTWYTAIDMQLAWLSPLVLLPLYHSPRAGLQLMTLLILISCFIPFAVTYVFRFPMSVLLVDIDIPLEGVPEGNLGLQISLATQARATPYLCGILFGYFLFKTKGKKLELSKSLIFLGWTCSTVVALTVIYSLSIAHQPDYKYDLVGSAFYAGFHRLGWSASLIWIIFACVNNYGGIVNKILSWNYLLPISRLTYCTFLMHFVIIMYETAIRQTISYYSDYVAVHDYFGDLIPIYIISFTLFATVEGPLLSLLKILFSKGDQNTKQKRFF